VLSYSFANKISVATLVANDISVVTEKFYYPVGTNFILVVKRAPLQPRLQLIGRMYRHANLMVMYLTEH
jgi:hypothetical protein